MHLSKDYVKEFSLILPVAWHANLQAQTKDNEVGSRSEQWLLGRKLHIYDGFKKHLLPRFHQNIVCRDLTAFLGD